MISFQTNLDSLVAQQNLNTNSMFQSNTIQQLTSGYRINSSGDDAAGLAVANQDRDQVAQITQGVANGNDGTAQLQIMDGGMSNISQILDRLQTLSTQSASSSFTGDRATLNAEFQTDIGELNRQAQAIGLNTGGTYAQSLDIYLGGGGGSSAAAVSADGQVSVNLSSSAVDAQALGLSGMQVVAGTADISTGSTIHSVSQIVSNGANNTAIAGTTTFYLSGPGFSDNSKVALSVNLSGVSDTNTLVTAINNAISSASNGTSAAAQALKSAGVTASVNTDSNNGQELAFSSSTSAFQVQAGDQMANALMGNFSAGSTGTAVATSVTGGSAATTGTAFTPTGVTVQISGAGLASPVSLTFGSAVNTVDAAINSLQTQVQQNTALQAAGITVSGAAGSPLVFTSSTGETFNVQSTGDTSNVLGLGSLDTSAAVSSPAFYSTITGAAPSVTGNGLATLGFSLNGGPTDGGGAGTAATIVGTAPTGITVGGTVNTSAAGTLALSVNGTAVSVNFGLDANKGATETLANVVKYVNNQVNAAMGWGSNVQTAAVTGTGASSTITLTDPYADSNSTLAVTTSATATALGLTGTSTGSDAVGNTITLNMAGGDATAAAFTSTSAATANVTTSGANAALNFSIDGQAMVASFANDTNSAGTAAVFAGGALTGVNTAALQAQGAVFTGGAIGANGSATVDTSALGSLTVNVDGLGATAVAFGADPNKGAAETLTQIASYINTTLNTAYGTAATYASGASGAIVISSQTQGAASSVVVTNNAVSQALDLTTVGQAGTVTQSGAAAKQLSLSIDGKASIAIDFSTDTNAGASESLANVATFIDGKLNASGTYGANYASAVSGASGALTITSFGKGSAAAVSVGNGAGNGNGAAAQALGLTTSGSVNPTTVNGKDETLAQVVSFLNTTAQQALGTSTAAAIFSANTAGDISIDSQTKGATSNVTLTAGSGLTASTGSIVTALGLTQSSLASGTGPTMGSIVNTLNQAFTANTTLQEAGLQATTNGTTLTIASSNNSNFRLDEYGTAGTNLGFGLTSGPFTGLTSGVSNASMIDAGGTSAVGNGSSSPYVGFTAMQFGSDAQAVTISANNSSGAMQALTITLRNDSNPSATEIGPQSGATIDSAVSFINSQLQQSNNPTLKSIVAVKENVGGTEEINFLSSAPSFNVSVGGSVNGNGLNGGTAKTFASVANGAAANASIDTLAGAQAAVTAVTTAVANLGTAQAAVGIGENQVGYAVNLAQSQITNISAAQSQIRDANVAQEAANLTKAQVLVEATVAAMAQANQEPQAILKLLQT
jgi:flagellin